MELQSRKPNRLENYDYSQNGYYFITICTANKQCNLSIWQKSFYDHIIRDKNDYLRICEYIENNPAKWAEDKYFVTG